MNNLKATAKELRASLLNDKRIKEYLYLKELFLNNEELIKMRNDLLIYKKENKLNEYNNLKANYDNHPLVVNYYSIKNEVKILLNEIIEILDI